MILKEGIKDPGILKAVFLAGGPGSGKTWVAKGLFGIPERVNVSQTVYGEKDANNPESNGFSMAGTNMSGGYEFSGQLGYLTAGDEMLSYGLTYNMSGISLGATMHNVTSLADANGVEAERDITEISLGYSLNDNAGLSLSMVTDNDGTADTKYMWLTLNVGL